MVETILIPCACSHCSCTIDITKGYVMEEKAYCSEACAKHKHDEPSPCCTEAGCCT
jgi:hypothetical protein